jgi:hypothetical protein
MDAMMHSLNFYFSFLLTPLPPDTNPKKPLGFSGGRMGDAVGGGACRMHPPLAMAHVHPGNDRFRDCPV